MAETNVVTETKPAAKPLSAKAQAKRDAEKQLRTVKPTIDAKGAFIRIEKANVKKPSSKAAKVEKLYANDKTVEAILTESKTLDFEKAESYARACLLWDIRHGFLTLHIPDEAK